MGYWSLLSSVGMRLLIAHRGTLDDVFVTIRKRFVPECDCDLLKSTASSFHVVEVTQSCRAKTKTRNDKVKVSTNASECIGRDHADDEIEYPIGTNFVVRECVDSWRNCGTHVVASAMPFDRPRNGKISAGKSHGIGPHVKPYTML
jgi:hypothetical protein